mgnify:FL=1
MYFKKLYKYVNIFISQMQMRISGGILMTITNGIVLDGSKSTGHVVVPEGVTSIGDHAFMYSNMESIELPSTLTSIGYCAFSDCKNLKRLVIPDEVNEISYGAFSGCENLEYIYVPSTVKSLLTGDKFSHCKHLKKIIITISLDVDFY